MWLNFAALLSDEHPDIFLTKQKELHHFTYDLLKEMEGGKTMPNLRNSG